MLLLNGDCSYYTDAVKADMQQRFASSLGVALASVTLTLTCGSVRATFTTRGNQAAAMQALFPTLAAFKTVLGIPHDALESDIILKSVVVEALRLVPTTAPTHAQPNQAPTAKATNAPTPTAPTNAYPTTAPTTAPTTSAPTPLPSPYPSKMPTPHPTFASG